MRFEACKADYITISSYEMTEVEKRFYILNLKLIKDRMVDFLTVKAYLYNLLEKNIGIYVPIEVDSIYDLINEALI